MKLTFTLLISFLVVTTLQAQITKGNWMLGGNINFTSLKSQSQASSPNNAYDIRINPMAGYFFTDKLATGLKTGITLLGQRGTGNVYSTYNIFDAGPFIRYYLLPVDNRVNILTEAVYQYGSEGNKNQNTAKNTFAFTTGAVAFFNSSVGIEFLATYSTWKFSGFEGSNSTIQLGIGLQVHLEK